ncbi:unnamed protein product [Periconia digitata]|uniref:Uncharacterized protein n=1 Tax=Periconia digitata TaxID=1303443 RepID=A0A9W4XU60_9PLEO|nr:unnamed protein product [Periconia digitata]
MVLLQDQRPLRIRLHPRSRLPHHHAAQRAPLQPRVLGPPRLIPRPTAPRLRPRPGLAHNHVPQLPRRRRQRAQLHPRHRRHALQRGVRRANRLPEAPLRAPPLHRPPIPQRRGFLLLPATHLPLPRRQRSRTRLPSLLHQSLPVPPLLPVQPRNRPFR